MEQKQLCFFLILTLMNFQTMKLPQMNTSYNSIWIQLTFIFFHKQNTNKVLRHFFCFLLIKIKCERDS